jgi:histidinol dehydrogenase
MTKSITRLNSTDSNFQAQLKHLLAWEESADHDVHQRVLDIIDNVRKNGNQAVIDYTNQFDHCSVTDAAQLEISQAQLSRCYLSV